MSWSLTYRAFVATAVVACWAAVGTAHAHEGEAKRSLVLQVDAEGVAGLWDVVAQGKRAALQVTMFDLNRDKELSGPEKIALASSLVEGGMAGVQITFGQRGLRRLSGLTARIVEDSGRQKSVEAVGLVTYDHVLHNQARWSVEVSVGEGYGSLSVQLQALGPWRIAGAEFTKLAADERGLATPRTVLPGGSLRFEIERGRESPKFGAKAGGSR